MPAPLAVTIPAAAAGLAYLNAKGAVGYDYNLVTSFLSAVFRARWREMRDRLSLFYILEDAALNPKTANNIYLIFEGRKWTYKQTYGMALKYGTWLKQHHGVKAKEIVAMEFGNSEKFMFMWFGLWAIGARPAFINYNLTGKALAHCVKVSTARLLVVDPQFADNITDDLKAELPGVQIEIFAPEVEAKADCIEPVRCPDADRSEDKAQNMALLIYTSGTTGLPKPAIVSWIKCIVSSGFPHRWMQMKHPDILYTSMPLYHSSAALLGTLNVLGSGAAVCIGRKFSTKLFWPEVRASKATIIQYVGETCRYLLAAPPQIDPATGANLDIQNNVRIAFGNGLRPDVWNAFKERFGIETIAEFYAATEGTGGSWNLSRNDFTLGAIGKVGFLNRTFLGGQSAIVAVDWEKEEPYRDPKTGFARKVAPNEPGELLLTLDAADIEKGFQGYFNNKKATSGKILRSVLVKDDAYFRTGDVIRKDSEGRSYFVDRIGDTFRWKSENVSTNEVSEVMGYHAAVHEANVYGVELPHHDGRAGCAAVILAEPPSEQLMKSLAEHVKALPKFAVPLFLRVTDGGGPITGTNKQQKHTLRAEGVSPEKVVGSDQIYWLKNGTYTPFTKADWEELNGGRVKL
ncbi:hypothetical protein O988_08329 [Pseudogymnoascus sp. VKM F-3808]|nr:hypothetical protein O988_08329 [Pseudogymnoascus sp. VKM F-3808]